MPGADIQGLSGGGGTPDVSGSPWEADAAAERDRLAQAKRQNMSLGLLAAGLATMAQPHYRGERGGTWRALGAGGLAGLDVYESGQAAAQKEEEDRQKERGLQAYRSAEIGQKQAAINATNQRADAALNERSQHDQALEANQAAGRQIQQQTANTNAYRATLEAQRNQIEAQKAGAETSRAQAEAAKAQNQVAPVGRDFLARYRGTDVEKRIPLPDIETTKAMPKSDAEAFLRDLTKSYAQMHKDPKMNIKFIPMGDGKIHKIVTDPDTGESVDTVMGAAAPKGATPSLKISRVTLEDGIHERAVDPRTGAVVVDRNLGKAPPKGSSATMRIEKVTLKDGVHERVLDPKTGAVLADRFLGASPSRASGGGGVDYAAAYKIAGLTPDGGAMATPGPPTPASAPTPSAAGAMMPPPKTRPPGVPASAVWGVSKSRGPGWKLPDGTFVPAGA